ncbi:unnamed protein product [Litomosoides sigmodontis]|uniref:Uncharacterized protein n=1 Tax=Litomosoides sigmodontis TaxID=42156 RepID=A0A3P6TT77_LITSI|nr:unnamed protein product [Litomosoides sigmodontis]
MRRMPSTIGIYTSLKEVVEIWTKYAEQAFEPQIEDRTLTPQPAPTTHLTMQSVASQKRECYAISSMVRSLPHLEISATSTDLHRT